MSSSIITICMNKMLYDTFIGVAACVKKKKKNPLTYSIRPLQQGHGVKCELI